MIESKIFHVLVPDNVHQSAIDILAASDGIRVSAPGKLGKGARCWKPSPMPMRWSYAAA